MRRLLRAAGLILPAISILSAPAAAVPMIPKEVVMRAMTPVEEAAHRMWSLRAALNVAALQCQFSPFLMTVGHYNDMLKQHSIELDTSRKALAAHFKRYDGKDGASSLDRYTTRTYNSFSTLDAQLAFCDSASRVGADVLRVKKGQLASFAAERLPEIRASLSPQNDPLTRVDLGWAEVPPIPDPCINDKGKRIKRC